jgi:hypothetical protein
VYWGNSKNPKTTGPAEGKIGVKKNVTRRLSGIVIVTL